MAEWLGLGKSFERSDLQPADAISALMPRCLFCCVYQNRGSGLCCCLTLHLKSLAINFTFLAKVKCGPGPCLILLEATAAVNNALP